MKIEPGDLIFVKGTHPVISPIVRWFTESPYTHVGIALNEHMLYEIDAGKEMGVHPNDYPLYDVYRYKYGLSPIQKERIISFILKKEKTNQGYDWLKVIAFGLEKIFLYPIHLDHNKRVVCSEIVDHAYAHIGIDLVPERKDGHVRPTDLLQSPFIEDMFTVKAVS